jgi:hypothetical protein
MACTGCINESRLIKAIEGCPLATAQTGLPLSVKETYSISTAGIWLPPVKGCTHKAVIKGPKGDFEIYFSVRDADPCMHLLYDHDVFDRFRSVVDLRACSEWTR